MTPERKIVANRENSRRSPGPRTSAGKRRSRANALRHGLTASVLVNPTSHDEIERLARTIAGAGADLWRLAQAREIAAAQLDLMRVQSVKVALMNSPALALKDPNPVAANASSTSAKPPVDGAPHATEPSHDLVLPPTIEVWQQLDRLARYERRAILRRSRAMRSFLVDLSGRATI